MRAKDDWGPDDRVTLTDATGLTCIHADRGLCPDCREEYEEDPSGWLEYGQHPAGLARWRALQARVAAASPPGPGPDEEVDVVPDAGRIAGIPAGAPLPDPAWLTGDPVAFGCAFPAAAPAAPLPRTHGALVLRVAALEGALRLALDFLEGGALHSAAQALRDALEG
jgi:hypothetical protein